MTVGGRNCQNLGTIVFVFLLFGKIMKKFNLYCATDQKEILNQSDENKTLSAVPKTPEPVDWEPQQDKCYFCVDGNIVRSNETGEHSESELNKHVSWSCEHTFSSFARWIFEFSITLFILFNTQIIESEDSSQSSDNLPQHQHHLQQQKQQKLLATSNFIPKQLEILLKNIIPDTKMTSLESMAAAQLAAFQRLQAVPDLNQLNPLYTSKFETRYTDDDSLHFYSFFVLEDLLLQQLQQHMSPSPTTPERTSSPSANKSIGNIDLPQSSPSNPGAGVGGEQPLDLSAKPCGSTSLMDPKNVFK